MNPEFIQSAPELELTGEALEQAVAWSSYDKGPIPLREFIAARAPDETRVALGLRPEQGGPEIKRVDELTEHELIETVCSRLQQGTDNTSIAFIGEGDFTIEDLVSQIRRGSNLGRRVLAAERGNIEFIERLVEAGKIRLSKEPGSGVKLPSFDF